MRDVFGIYKVPNNLTPEIHALRNGTLQRSGGSASSRCVEFKNPAVRVANKAVGNRVRVDPISGTKAEGRNA